MSVRVLRPLTMLLVLAPGGCAPLPQFPFAANADLAPPRVVQIGFSGATELVVGFDEMCELVPESVIRGETLQNTTVSVMLSESPAPRADSDASGDPPSVSSAEVAQHELRFVFSTSPTPSVEHTLEAQVRDGAGNHLRFAARFYGLNELIPAMVINEFTTQGSGSHPDLVEIRVLSDGNVAGACLYEGVPGDWDQRFTFPDLNVMAGDYIVVHFKPQNTPEERNETTTRDSSGGLDSSVTAWDFWVPEGTGLSGNNGVLTLCENPVGGIIDAVLYSNRTSGSDDRYRGFGSRSVMERADYIHAEGAWLGESPIRPEDAVNPEDSTSTRSMARMADAADTNQRTDWHITPTRGLTPGAANTDEVYQPN